MPNCSYCGNRIIVGGVREGDLRFCNARCQVNGRAELAAQAVPEQAAREAVARVHMGPCPQCGGSGPVDIHRSYRVWSVVVLTSFGTREHLCCRWCGLKAQAGDMLFSAALGWWGFPFGLVMTPAQIFRNLGGMLNPPEPSAPSSQLARMVRMNLVTRL